MHFFKFVLQFVFGLSDKLMGAVNTFKTGNYSRQPVAASWFLNSVDLPFFMEIKFDIIKDTISAKLSESTVIERAFYVIVAGLIISRGCYTYRYKQDESN